MKQLMLTLILASAALLISLGEVPRSEASAEAAQGRVVAVNNPLAFFAGYLLEDSGVTVELLVPADSDPALWQPSIDDILSMQQANLILLNGAGYSPWLARVSLPAERLVVTGKNFRDEWITIQGKVTHSHGPGGEHAHAGHAFTTWLDYQLAAVQASNTAAALAKRWPEQAGQIGTRLATLLEALNALDDGYQQLAPTLGQRQLIYSHPVYQYFERRYSLEGLSLHWEPSQMPAESEWQALAAQSGPDTLMIWEAEPSAEIASRLADLGIAWRVLDPGANRGHNDWLSLQRANLEGLQTITP